MFKIDDFAKFSRVSVCMLRHYDALGLLPPARVGPFTDYRYFRADQLPRLNRILARKDLVFTLEQIGGLLDRAVSAEEMRGMLGLRRAALQSELDDDLARLGQIESRIQQIESEQAPPAHEKVHSASDFVTELQIPVQRAEGDEYGTLFGHRQTGSRAANGIEGQAG
jgi:DNA-binding transcriptional MerR regulator